MIASAFATAQGLGLNSFFDFTEWLARDGGAFEVADKFSDKFSDKCIRRDGLCAARPPRYRLTRVGQCAGEVVRWTM